MHKLGQYFWQNEGSSEYFILQFDTKPSKTPIKLFSMSIGNVVILGEMEFRRNLVELGRSGKWASGKVAEWKYGGPEWKIGGFAQF